MLPAGALNPVSQGTQLLPPLDQNPAGHCVQTPRTSSSLQPLAQAHALPLPGLLLTGQVAEQLTEPAKENVPAAQGEQGDAPPLYQPALHGDVTLALTPAL